MPRKLTFLDGNKAFECGLIRIDRAKIYGSIEVVSTDHEGADADLLNLARDGRTLIGRGGTGSGYLNKDGFWVETGERIPVDLDGDPMEVVDSSFDAPIPLDTIVDEDRLLEHPVRLSYNLDASEVPAKILKKLKEGAIYYFTFSYRGGPIADPAFLLADLDGDLWMLVCNASVVEYLDYTQVAVCAAAPDEEVEDDSEDDNFDFDML